TARQGVLKNDDLFMASPLFRLTGKGSVNLPASTMDYHMRPKLVATLVGQGDQADGRTGVTIPLHISGSFDAPSITPELDAQSIVSGVKNVLKGGNPLKALGQNPASGTIPANPTQAAKEKVNKALGGLIPGF
ncbi:MAG: AsmA-like C-terminal region-containing protein, partial [Mariprofundaceae bacterium]|nr:AsmA-like C-terminal region-containing protein [Mariprofundaceae bacterium]